MKYKKIFFGSIIIFLMIMIQCNTSATYPIELDNLVPDATLIFKARIVLLNTTTTDEDDVSNTGVVEVEEIIDAPESFPNIKGEQITVRFSDINKVKVGEKRMFFTDPYWIGESLGVNEKGSILKDNKLYESNKISTYIKQARNNQDDMKLRKLIRESNLVFTGLVINTTVPEAKTIMGTEHDPEWKEAEIKITETLKGNIESETIKILFASSKDVMFYQSPKLKEGDEGIFIIQETSPQTAKLLENEFMVLNPSCYIKGKERTKHIKSLID